MIAERILITGISGFIGSSLAEYFVGRGSFVAGLSRRDIVSPFSPSTIKTDYRPQELARIVRNSRPDLIIHAAGSASVGASFEDPSDDFSSSVVLFQSLLEGVRISGEKPLLVFPSSAAVYGDPASLPVPENAALRPISCYGYHKVMCERLAEEYTRIYDIPSLVLRLFSVFGLRQKRLLLWELFEQFIDRPEVLIEGTGNEARDYIHVGDLARLVEQVAAKAEKACMIVNIASGTSVTVGELAYQVKEILHSKKPIVFQGKVRIGNPAVWQADVSLYERLTGQKIALDFPSRLQDCLLGWSESK